eukprot:CAMPEP_0179151786 /NCGR_PEP_ID=MMETSP0796-20121207/73719_1 /TAXON_ID=73915 /ORGANISM="Pyrodinium bahamense, Strain pbaha01" /LENGTH=57 /DNA_ID=CAMNT_0020852927 /DNA_START=34 /DNA_END=203 /DNA_ORIENTATION=-
MVCLAELMHSLYGVLKRMLSQSDSKLHAMLQGSCSSVQVVPCTQDHGGRESHENHLP